MKAVAALATAVTTSLAACSPEEPPSTVAATDPPAVWTLDSVPLLTIGEADSEDPAYNLYQVLDVWLLPASRVAVASRDETVRVFDGSGTFLHAFGRTGNGPTEFADLRRILKEGDSKLVALEFGRPRVSRWNLNGDLIDEYRYPVGVTLGGTEFVALDGGGIMAVAPPSGARLMELVHEHGPSATGYRKIETSSALIMFDQRHVDTLALVPGWTTFYVEAGAGFNGAARYARPTVGPWGKGAAFTSGVDGIVEFYDASGRLAARAETGRTGIPVTQAILDALERERVESLRAIGAPAMPRRNALPEPKRLPVYDRILRGGTECVWVRRYRVPGTQTREYDVVHPGWGLVATLTLPSNIGLRDIREDRVALLRADDRGVPRVEVVRLQRTGEPVCS